MINSKVIDNFLLKKPRNGSNLVSSGTRLFSYRTCIAELDNDLLYLNKSYYSVTTSRHLNMLIKKLNLSYSLKVVVNKERKIKHLY